LAGRGGVMKVGIGRREEAGEARRICMCCFVVLL
jgi:hypothetical protein